MLSLDPLLNEFIWISTLIYHDFLSIFLPAMEERDQKRKERRALIEAEKQRKEEARLVGY